MGRDGAVSGDELSRLSGTSRRDFLKLTAGAVALGAGGTALAACGSSSSGTTTTATTGTTLPANKIPKGGTLNVALTGGDSSDTVDGQKGVDNVDFARIVSLYDALVVWDLNCQPRYTLAESIEPNKAATVWTIKLRKGVTFHNGKPLTAQDVIYSYQRRRERQPRRCLVARFVRRQEHEGARRPHGADPLPRPIRDVRGFDHRLLLLPEHPARRFRPEEASRHRAVRVSNRSHPVSGASSTATRTTGTRPTPTSTASSSPTSRTRPAR